jgi:CBS domain-containing protein
MKTPLSVLLKSKKQDLISVSPDMSIQACIDLMNSKKIGAVPVLFKGAIVGMFTERDVLTKVAAKPIDRDSTDIKKVMTRPVKTVPGSMTVEAAMAMVTSERFRHLPVMEADKFVGIISSGDLTLHMVKAAEQHIEHLESYIQG